MATTNTTKANNVSKLFSLANNLKKIHNISQKEAFDMAKEQLEAQAKEAAATPAPVNSANPVAPTGLTERLESAMKAGNVRFSFLNEKGKLITTVGTTRPEAVPTTRKVDGKKDARSADMRVFYDVRHGIYRQFNVNKVVGITTEAVKRGRVKKVAETDAPAVAEAK